jgi:Putative quorum-sensing-regulated virulence factor
MNPDDQKACPHVHSDNNALLKLTQATMPYGKYAGRRLNAIYVGFMSKSTK